MMHLHLDFETYSACELKDEGLHNYANHPTTGVHCMAWARGDSTVMLHVGSVLPEIVRRHIESGGIVMAHNASFELAIWNSVCVPQYGWPPLRPEQCRCTMAMAYAMGLPGALEKAAAALGIEQQKDMVGQRVMLQLAKPKVTRYSGKLDKINNSLAVHEFWSPEDAPEKFAKLYSYCIQDVVVERELAKRMLPLSDYEQDVWLLDYKINQRGIQIDLPSIENAVAMVEAEKARLNREMLLTTGGVVGAATEVQLLGKWIATQGVEVPGLTKADVLDALKLDTLPPQVRRALEIRQEAAKSSTAKLTAMKNRASRDGRVRGIHQYHGAATGRWAGRGVQTQNLPRPRVHSRDDAQQVKCVYEINELISAGSSCELDMMYGPVMSAVADSIRGMIVAAPGKELVAADFSAIEARVLAWLAGQEDVLDVFREGKDIYCHAASGIYRRPITKKDKEERQIGKVAVLALGYQGGVGAFQSMARVYGVKVPDSQADEIKVAWREAHPKIVQYWYDLERAAYAAVVQPGTVFYAGPKDRAVRFKKSGSFLWCSLPGGRCLCYPYPRLAEKETPWGEMKEVIHYMSVNGTTNKWEETHTYGGSLAENVTQAVARDLLAEAMLRLESHGFDIVMHVHDECVVEIPSNSDAGTLARVEKIMAELPAWAKGLPVAAEGWRALRYRK